MFDPDSRYAKLICYLVPDHRGRAVTVVPVPLAPDASVLGTHFRREGERVDHLAAKYLSNPAGYWRVAECNDVMLPESLAEASGIDIPRSKG